MTKAKEFDTEKALRLIQGKLTYLELKLDYNINNLEKAQIAVEIKHLELLSEKMKYNKQLIEERKRLDFLIEQSKLM